MFDVPQPECSGQRPHASNTSFWVLPRVLEQDTSRTDNRHHGNEVNAGRTPMANREETTRDDRDRRTKGTIKVMDMINANGGPVPDAHRCEICHAHYDQLQLKNSKTLKSPMIFVGCSWADEVAVCVAMSFVLEGGRRLTTLTDMTFYCEVGTEIDHCDPCTQFVEHNCFTSMVTKTLLKPMIST